MQALKISPATLAKLAKLGIHSRAGLLLHLPLRYEDETHLTPITALQPGMTAQVQGRVASCEIVFRPRRTLVCRLEDGSGELYLRFLNFYPSQQKQLAVGKQIRAIGDARTGYFGLEMVHPKCRNVEDGTSSLPEALTPVYPTTAGLGQSSLRRLIAHALETLPLGDTLPESLRTKLGLSDFGESLRLLHNPPPEISPSALEDRSHPAWKRIKFDELLAQQLSMRTLHHSRGGRSAPPLAPRQLFTSRLIERLPFALTTAQKRALDEISQDLTQPYPMQRLLLGDVGSGKTIVAVLAALQAVENGYQVAFMAPTEILAEQHYLKLQSWLEPLGLVTAWLSGSHKKAEKARAADSLASGHALIAVGTHALFQKQVCFHRLGLVIVDEQHRFGVEQRLALRKKGSAQVTGAAQDDTAQEPHQLMMSATPIPRTLAMSYYADLDLSVIDEAPPGRIPVTTKLVSDARRKEVFERVRAICLGGQQAYWVCPLISESEALQLQTALETFQLLTSAFPELRIGLVHGKLESAEKAKVMAAFAAGELHLLVATTVIEVGVDVPNASLMVIDHAERMGLAQLHQLRGRVGRGTAQSMCILLFQQPLSELARARLKIIFENNDGFEIAQQDLRLRGPGELLGARQSGVAALRFANLADDVDLLNQARKVADNLLQHHPDVVHSHLQRWMPDKHDYLKV